MRRCLVFYASDVEIVVLVAFGEVICDCGHSQYGDICDFDSFRCEDVVFLAVFDMGIRDFGWFR